MGVSQQQRAEDNLYDPAEKIDRDNLETSFVFQDARRKLRLVLSEVCEIKAELYKMIKR